MYKWIEAHACVLQIDGISVLMVPSGFLQGLMLACAAASQTADRKQCSRFEFDSEVVQHHDRSMTHPCMTCVGHIYAVPVPRAGPREAFKIMHGKLDRKINVAIDLYARIAGRSVHLLLV